ncbi:uncharacterized protein LOC122365366 isoform X2 [Amphibalanus amphitrite]|uniref:uncharacterized protein LOC122365366 isoform X2 n=1 Tax=Amphibalanus amphitrite TaxID=1232801 RepID=UPI001C91EF3B|nr:uncharacterized protein LOC122365366 isoform X2 [Amphibalanus amphitrite]
MLGDELPEVKQEVASVHSDDAERDETPADSSPQSEAPDDDQMDVEDDAGVGDIKVEPESELEDESGDDSGEDPEYEPEEEEESGRRVTGSGMRLRRQARRPGTQYSDFCYDSSAVAPPSPVQQRRRPDRPPGSRRPPRRRSRPSPESVGFRTSEGRRSGSLIYIGDDGFIYNKRHLLRGTIYLRCRRTLTSKDRCPGSGRISGDRLITTTSHNHPADPRTVQAADMAVKMRELLDREGHRLTNREIFDKIQAEAGPDAPALPLNSTLQMIGRHRRRVEERQGTAPIGEGDLILMDGQLAADATGPSSPSAVPDTQPTSHEETRDPLAASETGDAAKAAKLRASRRKRQRTQLLRKLATAGGQTGTVMGFRVTEGRRAGSRKIVSDDGHVYMPKQRLSTFTYLRCVKVRSCNGSARIFGTELTTLLPHSHPPETVDTEIQAADMIVKMRELVDREGDHLTNREIFEKVQAEAGPDAPTLCFGTVRQMLVRHRKRLEERQGAALTGGEGAEGQPATDGDGTSSPSAAGESNAARVSASRRGRRSLPARPPAEARRVMGFRIVEGRRAGTRKFIADDGHVYSPRQRTGAVTFLRCVQATKSAQCSGSARTSGTELTTCRPHNHPPETVGKELEAMAAANRLRQMANTDGGQRSNLDIYRAAVADAGGPSLSYSSVQQMLRRHRRRAKAPALPLTPADAVEALSAAGEMQRRHHAFSLCVGEETAIAFHMPSVLDSAADSSEPLELQAEVLRRFVPRLFTQLLVVLVSCGPGPRQPGWYVLMTSSAWSLYEQLLRRMAERLGRPAVRLVVPDSETELREAAAAVWPAVPRESCWLHYARAVLEKLRACDLQAAYTRSQGDTELGRWARSLLIMPMVAERHLEVAWGHLLYNAPAEPLESQPGTVRLTQYLQQRWRSVPADRLSELDSPSLSSTTDVQGLYTELQGQILIEHPLFWMFVRHINAVIDRAGRSGSPHAAADPDPAREGLRQLSFAVDQGLCTLDAYLDAAAVLFAARIEALERMVFGQVGPVWRGVGAVRSWTLVTTQLRSSVWRQRRRPPRPQSAGPGARSTPDPWS